MKNRLPGILTFLILLCISASTYAQHSRIVTDFKPVCDSLSKAFKKRTSVKNALKVKNIMMRGNTLDFYFTNSLGDYPWYEGDIEWFRDTLAQLLPKKYKNYQIGCIYSRNIELDSLSVPRLDFNGKPSETQRTSNRP